MLGVRGALRVALWACVLSMTSADLFEIPALAGDLDNVLDDMNYIDSGPWLVRPEDPAKNLLQFIPFGTEDGNRLSKIPYGPKFATTEDQLNQTADSELLSMMKRVTVQGTAVKPPPNVRPVGKAPRKWHNKKGKPLGSHIVCYFKLCAFRRPEK